MVIQGLDTPNLFDEDTQKDRRATIANYFVGHINTHSSYIYKFIVCEFLNLVNIVGQVRNDILKGHKYINTYKYGHIIFWHFMVFNFYIS